MAKHGCFIFLLLVFLVYGQYPVVADDIAIVRERILESLIWPSQAGIPSTVAQALAYAHALNQSCFWSDINYYDRNIVIWDTVKHMTRIDTMLQALTVNGSSVQNDTALENSIHCALNIWLVHDWQNPNWWFNQINVPIIATSQLLMLGDRATNYEINQIKMISYRAAWWLERPQDVGANLVNMLQTQIYRSLATANQTGIEQAFQRMWNDVTIVTSGQQGIQVDWSYHFHGQQLMSGSYGVVWFLGIFQFLRCTSNTRFEMNQQQLLLFGQYFTKGNAWMIINNKWDWNVCGRAIARPYDLNAASVKSNWIRDLAQQINDNQTKIDLNNFADRLDNRPNATLLVGNKHFFTSDYQVHRRSNWSMTIKMQSIRTQGSECTNGENIKDEHGGQGILNLYTNEPDRYNFIFPILDWQAMNGITVEHDIPLEPCRSSRFVETLMPFVGGVSDGEYGSAMMDSASHNLTAKRSWHFYDQGVIALATNLTLKTTNRAWTTLASRLFPKGLITIGFFNSTVITLEDGLYSFPYTEKFDGRVQWVYMQEDNITFLFLDVQQQYNSIGIDLGNKTGNFETIGAFNHSVTARTFTLWIDHGLGPYTSNYSYAILPGLALPFIQQVRTEPNLACVHADESFHGVVWPSLKRASFVLWENVSMMYPCQSASFNLTVQLNDAGAYLFSETNSDFTITVSHPTRTNSSIQMLVDRTGSGPDCASVFLDGTMMTEVTLRLPTVNDLLGMSVSVTCRKTSSIQS